MAATFIFICVLCFLPDDTSAWHLNTTAMIMPSSTVIYCPWYRFSCGYKCIPNYQLCDGFADCYDGRDEMAEHCSSSVSPTSTAMIMPSSTVIYCPWYQFSCGYKCISNYRLCDGYADCYDGRDEMAEHCSSSVSPTSTDKSTNGRQCSTKIDLGFILDSSGSISRSEFDRMKTFVKDLTSYFILSPDETRVSVMSFSGYATIHMRFNQIYASRNLFNQAVDNTPYYGGGTNTANALNYAYNSMYTASYGARGFADVKKVLVVLTDGYGGMVSGPAQRLHNAGVVIFSVGIGSSVSLQDLHNMASHPKEKHVVVLNSFSQLSALSQQMSSKTCNASHFKVLCNSDGMYVVFHRSDLPKHLSPNDLRLKDKYDSRCRATGNQTHVYINVPLKGCGTTYSENEQTMSFTNALKEYHVYSHDGSVITREGVFEAEFTCTYGRKRTVGAISFEPAMQTVKVVKNANGNFTLTLDFFQSPFYSVKYTESDYPVFKSLKDEIYIQYSINSSNTDLVVHAETCRATPTNRPYDSPQYVFISDGCDNDTTIRHVGKGVSNVQRFSIQAFRFLAQHRFIYIHCDLVICHRNIWNSSCARGDACSRRYRRDVSPATPPHDASQIHSLSMGPLMLTSDSGNDEQNGGKGAASANTAVVGSLAGIACLVVVLAGVVVFGVKKYRLLKVARSVAPQGMPLESQGQQNHASSA